MSKPKVYFIDVDPEETLETTASRVGALFRAAGLDECIAENDVTALKMHFGERKNDTHIPPCLVKPVVDAVSERGGKAFLTDTCVLYKSPRDNAVEHIRLAHEHGFTLEGAGAPVVIADGLIGNAERQVSIPGKLFEQVSIASLALDANAMFVLTHVTGHIGTGLGGAIKNLGMGLASRKGKLRQHSVMKPAVSVKDCTGCWTCMDHCPADAIAAKVDAAQIDHEVCVGCGECLTVCRFSALKFDWNRKEYDLEQRMAEHALGAVIGKPAKVGYISFLMSITKDCDCFSVKQEPIIPDIGIVASRDPVAIDAASLDLIEKESRKSLAEMSYPEIDPWDQIRHGEKIGLGRRDYELIQI